MDILDRVTLDHEVVNLNGLRLQRRQVVKDNLDVAAVVVIFLIRRVPLQARASLHILRIYRVNRDLSQLYLVVVPIGIVVRAVTGIVTHYERDVVSVVLRQHYRRFNIEAVINLVKVLVVPDRGKSIATLCGNVLTVLPVTRAPQRIRLMNVRRVHNLLRQRIRIRNIDQFALTQTLEVFNRLISATTGV